MYFDTVICMLSMNRRFQIGTMEVLPAQIHIMHFYLCQPFCQQLLFFHHWPKLGNWEDAECILHQSL
jgi:hypothetical protein